MKRLSLPQCAKRAWRGDLRLVIDRSLPDRNRLRHASSPRTASARARQCYNVALVIIIIILQANELGFWLILHGQKCPKLCSILETGENLHILEYLEMGVAKWLNSATWTQPLRLHAAPTFALERSSPKSEHRCIVTRHTKKSQGALWKSQQEVRHFAFSGHFGHIQHVFTLMYLSQGFHQISFKFRWVSSKQDGDQN